MIQIRQASQHDIGLLQQLGKATFYPTYLPFINAEQVSYMFHKMYDEDSLLQQMNQRGDVFFIAFDEHQSLGFASCQINFKPSKSKLHKLYVLPDTQEKGIGASLMQKVEGFALQNHQEYLLLNVNRYNKAVGFYSHLGYSIMKEDDIDIGGGYWMNDYEMQKSLI